MKTFFKKKVFKKVIDVICFCVILISAFLFLAFSEAKSILNENAPPGMVLIPGGEFMMGENSDYANNKDESPRHKVYLKDFYMDKYLVTNKMFTKFVKTTGYTTDAEKAGDYTSWKNPMGDGKGIQDKMNYPAIRLSWNDATAYCEWSKKRLPTEAEFEKAARGGIATRYWQDDKRENNNWYNYDWVHPVGIYNPNPYQIYDILGYVWEWCSDWYGEKYYEISPSSNPQGQNDGEDRVLRGGAYWPGTAAAYSSARKHYKVSYHEIWTGCRCAKTP